MCISKEKAVRHYVDLFQQKFRNYLGRGGGVVGGRGWGESWMPIKDVQEWGVRR